MVLNNVIEFDKIRIKTIQLGERTFLMERINGRTDRRTGITLLAPTIVMAGVKPPLEDKKC